MLLRFTNILFNFTPLFVLAAGKVVMDFYSSECQPCDGTIAAMAIARKLN